MTILVNLLCLLLYVALGVSLWWLPWAQLSPAIVLALTLCGIFLADVISGLLHVFLDYFPLNRKAGIDRLYFFSGRRDTAEFRDLKSAVFAQCSVTDKISYNFKIHHLKPKYMNRKSYSFQVLDTVVPAGVLALLSFLLPPAAALCAIVVSFFVANTQFIHACIHDTDKSVIWKKVVQAMQRMHIVYSFAAHMEHHRYGQTNFCLITGWGNIVVNPLSALLFRHGVLSRDYWEQLRRLPGTPGSA